MRDEMAVIRRFVRRLLADNDRAYRSWLRANAELPPPPTTVEEKKP